VGLRAGLDMCRKSRPIGIRFPDRPARRQSLYRLRWNLVLLLIYLKLCTVTDITETINSNDEVIAGLLVGKFVCVRKRSWPYLTFYPRSCKGGLRKSRRISDRLVG